MRWHNKALWRHTDQCTVSSSGTSHAPSNKHHALMEALRSIGGGDDKFAEERNNRERAVEARLAEKHAREQEDRERLRREEEAQRERLQREGREDRRFVLRERQIALFERLNHAQGNQPLVDAINEELQHLREQIDRLV